MKYTQLSDSYKYDTLADAIYGRELEYFHYDFDRINFEYLVENATDPDFIQDVSTRLEETRRQMGNVVMIMEALHKQIDNHEAYEAAVERAIIRRKAREAGE